MLPPQLEVLARATEPTACRVPPDPGNFAGAFSCAERGASMSHRPRDRARGASDTGPIDPGAVLHRRS